MTARTSRSDERLPPFTPFDVVVVPFPYTDRLAEKRRPAIVVSQPELSHNYGLVWLLMVTSADNPSWDCDVAVSDLSLAGLPAPSLMRTAKIATADASRVLRQIGHLSSRDAKAVSAKIKTLMPK